MLWSIGPGAQYLVPGTVPCHKREPGSDSLPGPRRAGILVPGAGCKTRSLPLNHPQELAPTDRHDNPESSCVVSRNKAVGELTDSNLDREISQLNQTVESALDAHRQAEQTAVETAWRLGQHLLEKKARLPHGEFMPWCETVGITRSSSGNYMRIAEITSAGNLKASIRLTLRSLQAPGDDAPAPLAIAAPVEATVVQVNVIKAAPVEPKEVQVKVIEGEVVEAKAVEVEVIPPDDSASIIADLECALGDLQERAAIMEDGSDPKGREVFTKINNQAELIKTLKSSVALWQTKHADVMAQLKALKRRNKALEAAAAKAIVPTGAE